MKRFMLLVASLLFVFTLSACTNTKLECTDGIDTIRIEFDDEEITGVYDSEEGDYNDEDVTLFGMGLAILYDGDTPEEMLEEFAQELEDADDTITCKFK